MNRIRKLREARRLSQTGLSARSRVNLSALNRIEKWGMPCAPETKRKIARALGVKVGEAFPEMKEDIDGKRNHLGQH